MKQDNSPSSVRIDKWLWAARFFKARTLASDAVDGGKVQVNGVRVKPAKEVRIGDRVELSHYDAEWVMVVTGLADKRGPASVARTLYAETPESAAARQAKAEQRRFQSEPSDAIQGRPTKRDRRVIDRFRHG